MIASLRSYLEALPHEAALKPLPILLASVLAAVIAVLVRLSTATSPKNLHTLNPKGAFEISDRRVKAEFQRDATRLLRDWFKKNPDRPVVINGDMGAMTVLPPSMANEIRNDPRLGFTEFTMEMFHSHLHGFEPFTLGQSDHLIQSIVRKDLTKQLAKVTAPLVEETSLALSDILTDSTEWHEANVREAILQLVARISSRVFLGSELCRDPDWLRVTQAYTVTAFEAARQLRYWPFLLRPLANRFLPVCLTAQAMLREARAVIAPVLERRYAARAAAGKEYVESNDAMDWFATADPERAFDAANFQLALSFAAIHTTTDLLSETLLRIVKMPEIIQALREEIVEVYRADGWEKTALYKMKLLDSVIKETQRMKPISEITMLRKVKEGFTLSDGTRLRAGQNLGVTSTHFRSAELHTSPDVWDPRRWTRMRDDPARQNAAHLVSTTPEHNAFGHGRHACPGRFFAANEIKVALLGILLRYDVELPAEAGEPRVYEDGLTLVSDPMVKLRFRRREAEIDLDAAC
ncbi:trichothecene C-8 hydroxylase [Cordyceps fumosorosea ARSEF 2679]|uniref:Trichothecene C-8 hydroxylase n=1 Tax=Cordyceps fumosorosea (strain ARSEF 2679) TaxID=1081104 RepID=A0A162IDU6_CORFA|nr:trichothecene C-8 hydroxylase [Cordyceps fumosorosea ARSEF 2679]OAA55755.1 trichothecene C-8 hydroxylase [Cordyceps fumosorosea ARSEF 2679]